MLAHRSARARKLVAGAVVGGVVGLLAAAAAWVRPAFLERGELWTYDVRARKAANPAEASPEIVIVDIGEGDIENVETETGHSWPWPRAIFGYLVQYVSNAGAKAVVLDWIFQDPGPYGALDSEEFAAAMREKGRTVFGLVLLRTASSPRRSDGRWAARLGQFPTRADATAVANRLLGWNTRAFVIGATGASSPFTVWYGGRGSAEDVLRTWERLSGADELEELFRAPAPDGVEEPPPPAPPVPRELTDAELAEEITARRIVRERDALPLTPPAGLRIPQKAGLEPPLPLLVSSPARLGSIYQYSEDDGIMRRHALLAGHDGEYYPSLALAAYLVGHPGVAPRFEGHELVLGDRRVPLDSEGKIGIRFHRRGFADIYRHIPAWEVLRSQALIDEGKPPSLPADTFAGKYVILSATAPALRDIRVTPVSHIQLGAEIHANVLDNLLAGRFVTRLPAGLDALLAFALALGLALATVGLWVAIPSPRGALLAVVGAAALLTFGYVALADRLFTSRGLWIAVTIPAGGAIVATLGALLTASALERRDRRFVQEALGRYTSDELVKELVAHPEHLSLEWGEKREMTVFFSDIAGFTSFSEALEPERVVALLNEYLTNMTDIVLAHHGVVDKYIGDAIMAFWGAPLPDPDHARRAVLCALEMQRRCEELRPRWKAVYGPDVIARMGLNSGVAVVGNMGSRHKYNYTVMGDMVNLASRLEGANKPYGTTFMISEATYLGAKDAIDARELDLLAVKGKERPVRVYEVLAEKGRTPPALAQAARCFAEGLGHYRGREFANARGRFAAALEARPDDGPSLAYLARCDEYIAAPPGPDWDGVYHMKEK